MKKDTHPDYKALKVRIGKESFDTMSSYHGSEILMDVDFRLHPAWTGKGVASTNQSNQNINSFNKKFSGLSFGTKAAN